MWSNFIQTIISNQTVVQKISASLACSRYDFSNSDVYICGQEKACLAIEEEIKKTQPVSCVFFIEGFH